MKNLLFVFLFLSIFMVAYSQVGINIDGTQPASSAMLDVKSNNKGFLPPRLSTLQRDAITSPDNGLVIYNTDCNDLQFYFGGGWAPVGNMGMIATPGSINGSTLVCPHALGEVYNVFQVPGATGYNWIVPEGAVIFSGQGTNVILVNFDTTGGAISVYAYNDCWKSQVKTLVVFMGEPGAPQAGVHVPAKNAIQWNWTAAEGAAGYKWNTVNDYTSASDLGNVLTYTDTQLACNTSFTRFLWAYNICSHSPVLELTQSTLSCVDCGGTVTDTRNGKVYNTVAIGTQCWFRENLDIGTRINGIADQTNNQILEKYCQNDVESWCDIYGGLYQWGELVQYLNGASNTTTWSPAPTGPIQGICPLGWHIPDNAEWCTATQFLDPTVNCATVGETGTDIGNKMKESGTVHWAVPNAGATNSSGFTALPGGWRHETGSFTSLTYSACFWTTTTTYYLSSHFRRFSNSTTGINQEWNPKTTGYSVRCLRDE